MEETILQLHERREAFLSLVEGCRCTLCFATGDSLPSHSLEFFWVPFFAAFLLPKQYQAEMKILVKRERVDPILTSDKTTVIDSHSEVSEEQVQSEVELLRSRDLLENVVKACGLAPSADRSERSRAIGQSRYGPFAT